jgi:hypothetical protein
MAEKEKVMCCGDRFDEDELGLDPEEDEVYCEECGERIEECECEGDDDDAELSF